MSQSNPAIDQLLQQAQSVNPEDPDMMAKLNEIAQQIAQAQGRPQAGKSSAGDSSLVDPMDELGCEGCQ